MIETERQAILEEAIHCVCGDRDLQYGNPEDNFKLIANLWSEYLVAQQMDPHDIALSATDVAIMMVLFKVARVATGSSRDTYVDIAGYAACAGELNESRRV